MSKIKNLANYKSYRLVLAVGSVLLVVAGLFFSIQGGTKKLSATKCSTLLDKTYEGISGFGISQDEVDYIIAQGGAPTYGEIVYSSMEAIIRKLGVGRDDVFYDLGSGVGKFPIWMHLTTDAQKSVGIELSESRHKGAMRALKQLLDAGLLNEKRELSFLHDNITKVNLSDATIVFMAATCFSKELLQQLVDQFLKLQPGLRIVTLKELPAHPRLKLTEKEYLPTSWSKGSLFLYYELLEAPASPVK